MDSPFTSYVYDNNVTKPSSYILERYLLIFVIFILRYDLFNINLAFILI